MTPEQRAQYEKERAEKRKKRDEETFKRREESTRRREEMRRASEQRREERDKERERKRREGQEKRERMKQEQNRRQSEKRSQRNNRRSEPRNKEARKRAYCERIDFEGHYCKQYRPTAEGSSSSDQSSQQEKQGNNRNSRSDSSNGSGTSSNNNNDGKDHGQYNNNNRRRNDKEDVERDANGQKCPVLSVSHWWEEEQRITCACARGTRPMEDWKSCVPNGFCEYFFCQDNIVNATTHAAMKKPKSLALSSLIKWRQRMSEESRKIQQNGYHQGDNMEAKEAAKWRMRYALDAAEVEYMNDDGQPGSLSYRWMFETDDMEAEELVRAISDRLFAEVAYDFVAENEDELSVKAGDIVQIVERSLLNDPHWALVRRWSGEQCLINEESHGADPSELLEEEEELEADGCIGGGANNACGKGAAKITLPDPYRTGMVPRWFLGYISPSDDRLKVAE